MAIAHVVEGWCTDPFGTHEARWFSAGEATALVRDDGREYFDEPSGEMNSAPKTIAWGSPQSSKDLLRSDVQHRSTGEVLERATIAILLHT